MVLTRLALRLAARRTAPDTIPRSGPRTAGLDCYTTYIHARDDSWSLLVGKVSERGVIGRLLEDGAYQHECCMFWSSLRGAHFEFTHYIGPYDFRYSRVGAFLRAELIGLHRYWIYRNRVEQFFFNKRRLARMERIEALRRILENSLNQRDYRTSHVSFFAEIHTHRSFLHPDKERQLAYMRLLLDSLVESGELKKVDHLYKVSPRALATLAQYEEEERRHRNSVRQQVFLAVLTFGLVLVGIMQVWIAAFSGR